MKKLVLLLTIATLAIACSPQKEQKQEEKNPESTEPSFDPSQSDSAAVSLADQVIAAHGGVDSWNQTRYIAWNFLGVRDLIWDKYTGDVRIDFPAEKSTYLININSDSGKVKIGDQVLSASDSLDKYLTRGKQIWVNDSYWLVFPFKLKDPGVRLSYEGRDTTQAGTEAEVISLTFEKVGFTPQNKYKAYISPDSHLILQWDYFQNATDTAAAISGLWSDYKTYGELKLSSGRGTRELKNIKVAQEWDKEVFTTF